MRNLLLAGAAALATLTATPAAAQAFSGPRVELQTGVSGSNIDNTEITYGALAGYDFAASDRVILGVDVNATNLFDHNGRVLGAGARVGYALNPNILAYARGGYANLRVAHTNLDGFTAGGGLEFRLPRNAYINTEYRYSKYEQGVHSNAGILGIGIRF